MRRTAAGAGAEHGSGAYSEARRPLAVAEPSTEAKTKCRWAKAKPETPLNSPDDL